MSKYTPGPWRALVNDIGAFEVSAEEGPYAVLCTRGPWPHRAEESAANARLIAAAPELLEALRAVDHYWHDFQSGNHRDWDGVNNKVRAAIAKAEGKTE